ncbi:hypothetical protein [Methylobacterium oryzae]|uniref:hypothetical protein n=1 Tax=Methylobacterium oryzae TaxID=334852 RepID=UPI0005C1DBAB|nr:hypothetical protein [Methylobacterium oryzae]
MTEYDHAAELATWIEGEECGTAADGLHLGPTDLTLVAKALRALAALAAAVAPLEEFEIA